MKRILASVMDGKGFDIGLVLLPLAFLLVLSGLPLVYNVVMSFQEVDMFSLAINVASQHNMYCRLVQSRQGQSRGR